MLRWLGLLTALSHGQLVTAADGVAFFEKKIRPVLVEHCYRCHAADAKQIRGGLQLDTRAGIRQGGESGPAVVPNKADESLILAALRHEDYEMPPDRKLPAAVIRDFERWIEMGAPDPREGEVQQTKTTIDLAAGRKFWAFQPPQAHQPPAVKDKEWSYSDIDRFVLARLEAGMLRPTRDASRRALIRRAYFDLIGLPPTPEQIDAFVNDQADDAFVRVVDQLLESRHFGERWGRHWLDVARYAESSGGGRTQLFPNAWRYRDYVIRSFTDDKPYDQFIAEQIAGDLMEPASTADAADKLTALGFLALGPTNYELQDKELLRMEVIDEQIDTIGKAMLGLTIGCARCHDHKFDPIPTKDYYALAGIFRSTRTLTPGNVSGWVKRALPMTAAEQATHDAHLADVQPLEQELQKIKQQLGKASQPGRATPQSTQLRGTVVDDEAATFVGNWTRSTSIPAYVDLGYRHSPNPGDLVTFTANLAADTYEVRLAYSSSSNRATNALVSVHHADGTHTQKINQRRRGAIDGLFVSLGTFAFAANQPAKVTIQVKDPDGTVIADAVQFLANAERKSDAPVNAQSAQKDQAKSQLQQQAKALEVKLAALKRGAPKGPATVMAVEEEAQPDDYHLCVRGNAHMLGEKVPRGFLRVLSAKPRTVDAEGQSGRLQLAQWLASEDNPLTARVMVNRIWLHLLGQGIVRTPDSFGFAGERPSHPQLLDHLALQFMHDGWSIKRAIRRIMLSRVYQLSSVADSSTALDPENVLLSHARRKRLSAEAIRDAILATSGQLDLRQYGAGMKAGTKGELGYKFTSERRGIYVPCFRNTVLDLFTVFDIADSNLVSGKRNVSAVPTQALFMMNSPFVMDQAEHFANRLLEEADQSDEVRIQRAYRIALGRLPTTGEQAHAERFLRAAREFAESKDNAELVAWSGLCHALYASVDFRYVD